MAAILNSAILDSAILHKSLTQTSSIWLKLIHSDSTWWWQPSWILPSWIQTLPSWIQTPCSSSLRFTQKHSSSTLTLIQTNSIWLTGWWQPSWILPSWIQPFCTKLWLKLVQSDSNSFILTQLDDGSHLEFCHLGFSHFARKLKLDQSDSNSFILTQLDDGSHLEFCHLGFRHCHLGFKHLVIFSQIHSKTLFLYSDFDSN